MPNDVARHYAREGVLESIHAALRSIGKDPSSLRREGLDALDQLHVGGRESTLALARLANLRRVSRILDVGSGLGGPARLLASQFECDVVGVGLTAEYCHAASELTRTVGLDSRVSFRTADALDLPFEDGAFDVVWSQHCSMNIEDKQLLYREMRRVLRARGVLAIHEICAGSIQPIHFPVVWARDASISFLLPPSELRELMHAASLVGREWRDTTQVALDWFHSIIASVAERGPPPVSPAVVLGSDFPQMVANMARNLGEGRLVVIEAVFDAA